MVEGQTVFEQYAKLISGFEFFQERFTEIGKQLCEIEAKVDKTNETLHTQELRMQKIEGSLTAMGDSVDGLRRWAIAAVVMSLIALAGVIALAAFVLAR